MKTVLLLVTLFLIGCNNKDKCLTCSAEFVTVGVQFKDVEGKPLVVDNFTSIIKRTGLTTQPQKPDTLMQKGFYAISTDSDLMNISSEGDIVIVSAVNPRTKQKKEAIFIIGKDKCSCHVQKISGPEEIIFD